MSSYETSLGTCICGDSRELLSTLSDNSVDLVVTSPPFALQRKKAYGNEEQDNYVDWLCKFAQIVYNKIKETGSFVIDIGAAYEKGSPNYSLYQFKALIKMCDVIGFKLAQPFYWHNPSALPAPIEWVNKRKLRAKNSVNTIWWLCKNPSACKADIRKVLIPYSDRMKKLINHPEYFIKDDDVHRPSGHVLTKDSWTHDNGGSIPPNLLQIPNSESNTTYLRYCKLLQIKGHPARFPSAIPEFFIKLLTDEGDLVVDIFSGSNTTGMVCEKLKRHWKSFELSPEYVANSSLRFADSAETAQIYYDDLIAGNDIKIHSNDLLSNLDL